MKFFFISSMQWSPWGGSEELWGRSAMELLQQGHRVEAGLWDSPRYSKNRADLEKAGCRLHLRKPVPDLSNRILNRIRPGSRQVADFNPIPAGLRQFDPDLVIISQMFTDDGLKWMEFCRQEQIPYVTIVQAASEYQWPSDDLVARMRESYLKARKAYFVSKHNLRLCEMQIAAPLTNGEVVCNPFALGLDKPLDWPQSADGVYRLASVGRLQPDAKGQDILIDVLAETKWKQRPVSLTFFGEGCNRQWAEAYCRLRDVAATFGGFATIQDIWRGHHLLVHPARKEGMPIVVVEAALCGRPVVATATAGIPEFVQDEVNGFLAPFPDVCSFDAALDRAWAKRDEWPTMGRTAAALAAEQIGGVPERLFADRLVKIASAL